VWICRRVNCNVQVKGPRSGRWVTCLLRTYLAEFKNWSDSRFRAMISINYSGGNWLFELAYWNYSADVVKLAEILHSIEAYNSTQCTKLSVQDELSVSYKADCTVCEAQNRHLCWAFPSVFYS
jgi:hypothetical protein